jgi:hypothetical protein
MQIIIELKSVYGLQTYYPYCEKSKLFAKIAGTKTLTKHALTDIKKLGYEIHIKTEVPDFV